MFGPQSEFPIVSPIEPIMEDQTLVAAPPELTVNVQLNGKTLDALPDGFYVRDQALVVFLESFEGPLDLLLHLIRKRNLDILDFSIAEITTQYMQYLDLMSNLRLQVAGEYMVMAATLMMIKSHALLPELESDEEEEEDAAIALRRRLQAYKELKEAAETLDAIPRLEREVHSTQVPVLEEIPADRLPDIDLHELVLAFSEVIERAKLYQHHAVVRPVISVRERMAEILTRIEKTSEACPFESLFDVEEGKQSVIASLLALLELLRGNIIEVLQAHSFSQIHVKMRQSATND